MSCASSESSDSGSDDNDHWRQGPFPISEVYQLLRDTDFTNNASISAFDSTILKAPTQIPLGRQLLWTPLRHLDIILQLDKDYPGYCFLGFVKTVDHAFCPYAVGVKKEKPTSSLILCFTDENIDVATGVKFAPPLPRGGAWEYLYEMKTTVQQLCDYYCSSPSSSSSKSKKHIKLEVLRTGRATTCLDFLRADYKPHEESHPSTPKANEDKTSIFELALGDNLQEKQQKHDSPPSQILTISESRHTLVTYTPDQIKEFTMDEKEDHFKAVQRYLGMVEQAIDEERMMREGKARQN